MKTVGIILNLVDLWSLVLIISSSNPDTEIVQDSHVSDDQSKGKSFAPLMDPRSNPRVIYDREIPQIIVTSIRIPVRTFTRISQRLPVVSTFGNRHVNTFVHRDSQNVNNNNNRGDGFAAGTNLDAPKISGKLPVIGEKANNKTSIFNSQQQKNNLSPAYFYPFNVNKIPSTPATLNASYIHNGGGSQGNQGEITNRRVMYTPAPVDDAYNALNVPINDDNQRKDDEKVPVKWPVKRPFPQSTNNQEVPLNTGYQSKQKGESSTKTTTIKPVNNRRHSPDANLFAGMINDFAFDLVRIMNLNTNFVISPLSIFIALSVCYLASDGVTKAELEDALKFNHNSVHGAIVHESMKDLIALIAPKSNEFQLFLANIMFVQKNYTVSEEFAREIRKFYGAQLENLDFGNLELSLKTINDWVSRSTQSQIPSFASNPPHPLTRVILLNAVYFKGIWKKQFPLEGTYEGRFFDLDGNSKTTPTMSLFGQKFSFLKSAEHKHSFIRLPYEGDEISMVIALPDGMEDRPFPNMNDRILCHVQDALKETPLYSVIIPKFHLEYTRSLKKPLALLGITSLFNTKSADLSKLRKEKDLFVTGIHHKAVVEVSEEGTIAAAKTEVDLEPLAYSNTTDFIADHPFAFYIIHEASGLVLFHGKIFDVDHGY